MEKPAEEMERERKRLNLVFIDLEKAINGNKGKIEEWLKKKLEVDIDSEEIWIIRKEKKITVNKVRKQKG